MTRTVPTDALSYQTLCSDAVPGPSAEVMRAVAATFLFWIPAVSALLVPAPRRLVSPELVHPPALTIAEVPDSGIIAQGLGYLVGAGSLLLYTPIAMRVVRQRDASGLTLSTWWLKLLSYSCSDVYSFANGFPLSTYVETLIITVEAAVVLAIVAFFQRRLDGSFIALALGYGAACAWALSAAPASMIAFGQAAATLLNTGALLPQLLLNFRRRSPGGYSPLTAGLACAGCAIRLFTTVELAGSDPLLLAGFAFGLFLNAALLAQIGYYGAVVEGRPLAALLAADFSSAPEEGARRLKRRGGAALSDSSELDEAEPIV